MLENLLDIRGERIQSYDIMLHMVEPCYETNPSE